ncbi:uncharacterized protein LOC116779713 [Danaus plexippus]|uniref:Uncharacterized protein n=1 Tax=Danaus plexippus plexippus TaxID=278856 RepID=A0A212FGC3_DANPL|nr:uncharacterized protein LOC116779713 [Danaus plexippus]OWR52786.1 hypothetical protein KGM_210924 [Danaus plexippus plexippus]
MMNIHALVVAVFSCYIKLDAVPPEACFAKFRWENCGGVPERVFYYWKPGSRCEVGIWQGCLPNLNMFKDEYECVSTCIFGSRALAPDYHVIVDETTEATTEFETTTELNTEITTDTEGTGSTSGPNVTATEPAGGNSTGGGANTTATR